MKTFSAETPVNSYNLAVDVSPPNPVRTPYDAGTTHVSVHDLDPFAYAGQTHLSSYEFSLLDGGKFAGGFGPTQLQVPDYWTLRARSAQLFNENLYARGLIRRLITNEINTGLTPEACPDEKILGLEEGALNDWCENIENRFALWGDSPYVCDWKQDSTFGAIQRAARQEALVAGDVLVVLRQNPTTRLPMVQLVRGDLVLTPFGDTVGPRAGNIIRHGVELDAQRRTVAFWVRQPDGTFKRLPAFGEKSGRRLAWLVYGTDKRLDDVRGQPLLSLVLQSLKEIDRYRDSAQRKAVVNSILAMFIKKTNDKLGTIPITGAAVRRDKHDIDESAGRPRQFNSSKMIPGFVIEELQVGEEPVLKGAEGIDINFGVFEEAIIQAVAWANEIPPEILRLAFSNNYSASQAAINEFKIYLNRVWSEWGETFCQPIYIEYAISDLLRGKITAPGLLEAWRDPAQYDVLAAWLATDWYGSIKPSTDTLKQVRGSELLVAGGYSTRAREARTMTGTKFTKNIKRLLRENQQLAEALRPMLEVQAEYAQQGISPSTGGEGATALALVEEALAEFTDRLSADA